MATRRSQLPRSFAMHVRAGAPFAFEYYKLIEWEEFAPKLEEQSASNAVPRRQHDLEIEPGRGEATLRLFWNPALGQPPRRGRPRPLSLRRGEWARIIINGRYASYSGQYYTEATYNVALDQLIATDVFLSREANQVLDLREDLF